MAQSNIHCLYQLLCILNLSPRSFLLLNFLDHLYIRLPIKQSMQLFDVKKSLKLLGNSFVFLKFSLNYTVTNRSCVAFDIVLKGFVFSLDVLGLFESESITL